MMRALILFLILAPLGGCNVVGYAAHAVSGPPTVPAAYPLGNKPTVVLAEKFDNPGNAAFDAEPMARFITDELKAHNAAPMIDPAKVDSLRQSRGPAAYRAMTIAAVGNAVGAEQVIYVNILRSELEAAEGTDTVRGSGEILVKVIDARTGATLWPTDAEAGKPVSTQTRLYRQGESAGLDASIRTETRLDLAARAARFFYSYSAE
jgi:hypothetical protein